MLNAEEAAGLLGVQVATLYAYVSRGLLKSTSQPGSRRRLYREDDVVNLKQQRVRQQHPEEALKQALHFGDPLLVSNVSSMSDGRLFYRGRDAIHLASQSSYEEVVAWLWQADPERLFSDPPPDVDVRPVAFLPPLLALQTLLPRLMHEDELAFDFRLPTLWRRGVRLIRLMAALAVGAAPLSDPVADILAGGWKCTHARAKLTAALILCADHELNVSTFTARCAASAQAPLYGAVLAALSAFQGLKHGAHAEQVQALWAEVHRSSDVRQGLVQRVRRGETLPGFGHSLYPHGDPRARALLEDLPLPQAHELALIVYELTGLHPTVDFALVALSHCYGLPPHGAVTLFAQGRLAGWIAHILEQYEQNQLIRPRARATQ